MRPEDFVHGAPADAQGSDGAVSGGPVSGGAASGIAGGLTLPATVDVCEPLGNETLVYWQTPAGPVVSRAAGSAAPSPGSRATLTAAWAAVHSFDAATEKRLGG